MWPSDGELRAGAHRSGDAPRPAVGHEVVAHLARDACRGEADLVGSVGEAELGERDGRERAERVGLDHVHADVEERGVKVAR